MGTVGLLGTIGNTPLVELPRFAPKAGVRIFAKLEGQNPSGSVKDRIVLAMVEAAERKGLLKPGDTIVEASSGNTGIALAMIGKQKGYRVCVVLPEVAPSIGDILALYDVETVWSGGRGGMRAAIEQAREIARKKGGYFLDQFDREENMLAHYLSTGPEVLAALPHVDVFVAGIGTGGTIMGVGRRLREANPHVHVIGVEPRLGERLQGLRSLEEGYIPPLLDLGLLNRRFIVDSASALAMSREVVRREGIMAGVSSGATLHIAARVAERIEQGNVVVMFSDGGWKYLPARPWEAAAESSPKLDDVHWW
jgi:cysteine synthase B